MEDHIEGDMSMAYKELVPIVLAAECWAQHWSRKRILFFCDNQATVAILNKGRSRSTNIMQSHEQLSLLAATHNFAFSSTYIASVDNGIADSLSRFQMERFRELAPNADLRPQPVPHKLVFPWWTSHRIF